MVAVASGGSLGAQAETLPVLASLGTLSFSLLVW